MHFWIDKRSSQLYNYGGNGRRPPGSGGFYSRTYGTRHLPPRSSSSFNSSNASSSSHYTTSASRENPSTNNSTPPDVTITNNNPFQIPFTSRGRFQGTGVGNQQQGQQQFRYPVNIGDALIQQNGDYRNHLGGVTGMNVHSSMALRGGINAGLMGPPSRRPRSQGPVVPGRRRSSSGGVVNHAANQQRRTSMYRWTYDPNHHQYPRPPPTDHHHHHHHQQQVWNELSEGAGQHQQTGLPNQQLSTPINLSELTAQVAAGMPSTSSQSDPAWKRTKRIGLTLCFMAFILLSTVAAKFVIEGPWLIDKTPRSERTEATIYFFLTELIFVAFAMALFFTGVTCLRKRTNAYLLRQFNQYILQTSPHGSGTTEFFHAGGRNPNQVGMPPMQGSNVGGGHINPVGGNINPQGERPFAYLPSLETSLLMNVEQNPNLVGCSKPPPYHIALYLPVPDDYSSTSSKDHKDDVHSHHTSPWISSTSCGVSGSNGNSGRAGGIEKTEDSDDEVEEGIPRRKRQKKDEEMARSETPPPPYGQI